MEVLANLDNKIKEGDVKIALRNSLGKSPEVLSVMIQLISDWPDKETVHVAINKINKWEHLRNFDLEKHVPENVRHLREVIEAFGVYMKVDPAELPKKKGRIAKATANALQEHFS